MSFRVLKIAIYARHGEARRVVEFRKSGVTIITGVSRRGKSAVQAILDYLLMSGGCAIPRGVVRDRVSHVGGLYEREDGQRLVVVRAVPTEGHRGSQDIHVQTGHGIGLPKNPVSGRWNLKSARGRMSDFAGIESLRLLSSRNRDDEQDYVAANIRHVVPFVFQPQDVVASRAVSFPGLEDFWKRRHVLDALDYILRIYTRDLLAAQQELRRLESKERAARRRVAEIRRLGADGYRRGLRLVAEAIATGLAPDGRLESMADIKGLLQEALAEGELDSDRLTSALVPIDAVETERSARTRHSAIQHQIARLAEELETASAHGSVVSSGIERISLRCLLPSERVGSCPVCGSQDLDQKKISQQLQAAADSLGREQAVPKRLHSETEKRLDRLRDEEVRARSEMKSAQRKLRSLFEYLSENRSMVDEIRQRERLRGRIESYLAAAQGLEEVDPDDSAAVVARIEVLRKKLGKQEPDRKNVQRAVEEKCAEIASSLGVEFREGTRVNISSLVIEVRDGRKWVPLSEIGSGANWVSYHVAAALGFARVCSERDSPVPRFVVFDQPSQAWFPADVSSAAGDAPRVKVADREAVETLYRELVAAGEADESLQIIVLDHVNVEEEWFRACVREDWHIVGKALVPDDWRD